MNTEKLAKNAKLIIMNAKKTVKGNKSMHGAWIESNGKQYVCDSHRILEINNPIKLPESETVEHIKCYKMIDDLKRDDAYILVIPSLREMEEHIKELRERSKYRRILVSLGKGQPAVNAEYLFQMSEALGGVDIAYINKANPTNYPFYLESEIGTAYLLPCHNPKGRKGYWLCN